MLSVSLLLLSGFAALAPKVSALPRPVSPGDLITQRPLTDDDRIDYLIRYGHLRFDPNQLNDNQVLRKAISNLQRFAGIPVTGEMDEATDRLMATPRCGVPDDLTATTSRRRRSRRYVVQGSKWRQQEITYLFRNYTSKLPTDVTRKAIVKALQFWSDVTPLDFAEAPPGAKAADIKMRFARRDHGDKSNFDGSGGVLAHAFFPSSGETHFDEDEPWTNEVKSGVNFFQVATHELGHALGLSHSKVSQSVMAPFYKGYSTTYSLTKDDVDGIQVIYGKRKKPQKMVESQPDPLLTSTLSSKPPTSTTTQNDPFSRLSKDPSSVVPTTAFPTTTTISTTTRKEKTTKTKPIATGITTTTSSSSAATTRTLSPTRSTISTTSPTTPVKNEAVPTSASAIIGRGTTRVVARSMRPPVNPVRATSSIARKTPPRQPPSTVR